MPREKYTRLDQSGVLPDPNRDVWSGYLSATECNHIGELLINLACVKEDHAHVLVLLLVFVLTPCALSWFLCIVLALGWDGSSAQTPSLLMMRGFRGLKGE